MTYVQSLPTLVNIKKKENTLKQQEVRRLTPKIENYQFFPKTPDLSASLTTAEALFHRGEYIAAIQKAEQVIKQHPLHFDACYLLAQAWANLGKAEKAACYCMQAIEIDPLSTHCYYLLAHIAEEKGDTTKAKKLLRKIIYLVPASIDAYLELGDIYQREGDMIKAKKMRTTAWELLNQLPANFMIEPSKNTVSELTVEVSNLLQNHP